MIRFGQKMNRIKKIVAFGHWPKRIKKNVRFGQLSFFGQMFFFGQKNTVLNLFDSASKTNLYVTLSLIVATELHHNWHNGHCAGVSFLHLGFDPGESD